jgi:hypothetical protein
VILRLFDQTFLSTRVKRILRENTVLSVDEDAVTRYQQLELQSASFHQSSCLIMSIVNLCSPAEQANFIVLRGGVVTAERQAA